MNEQLRQQETGDAGNAPLWIAGALVLAGVVGYYLLDGQGTWVRWASVVAGLVAGALVFAFSAKGREFGVFLAEARNELRKVFWPTKNETWITTALVFGFAVIAGLFFWLLDLFLAWATRLLTGQGG
jgi:preprotein translocase subunit SecE